ncbi:hypothetical protein PspLS_09399 [Pyricularia sp. CBS 133598]|nr:hypothetical protein PspLS_09399 [Pyricularia sp. CBS 133598]
MPPFSTITDRLTDGSHDFSLSSIWAAVWGFLSHAWTTLRNFISQPRKHAILLELHRHTLILLSPNLHLGYLIDVWPIVLAWVITFTVIMLIFSTIGFGPAGVIAGTFAAGVQSWMYGGFTPAGGLFAVFTSMGMLGVLLPAAAIFAAFAASGIAALVWAFLVQH